MKSVLEVIELEQAQAKAELKIVDPPNDEAEAAIEKNKVFSSFSPTSGTEPG